MFIAIFIAIVNFLFLFWVKEVAEILRSFGNVFLRQVGVNLPHCPIIRPASDLHCDFFRYLEVIGKGSEAVPEGAACKIFVEKGLVQWKNQPFGGIMDL